MAGNPHDTAGGNLRPGGDYRGRGTPQDDAAAAGFVSGCVLSIDPGERIGWARSDWTCGTLDLTAAFKRDQGEALAMFAKWLSMGLQGCVLLVIERPFGRHAASVIIPSIIAARAHEAAFLAGVPRRELAVSTIRKLALGSGKAKKAEVLPAMLAAGWPCRDDHSADACALLMAAVEIAKVERLA